MKLFKSEKSKLLILFFIFLAFHLILLCTTRLYPFLDIPNHLALSTIYKFYDEPGNRFSQYYVLDLFPKPNIFHMIFCSLKIFPTVENANRIFYCLYVLLYALSVYLVIKKAGGNPWYALLSLLLIYNFNVSYGFTGFTIAIPVVLLVLYCILCDTRSATFWNSCSLAILFLLLFFMHALATVFSVFVFCVYCAFKYRRCIKVAAVKFLCVVPVFILMTHWWIRDSGEFHGNGLPASLYAYYSKTFFYTLYLRAGFLVHDNFRLYGGPLGYTVALFFSLFIISVSLSPVFFMKYRRQINFRGHAFKSLFVFGSCSGCCVLFSPETIPGFSLLFERFSIFLMLSIVFIGSMLASERLPRVFKLSMLIVCCLHCVLWFFCMRDFNKENITFNKDFFSIEAGCKTMASLIYDYRFRNVSMYDNFLDYYIVWTQGIATTRSIDERSFPVKRKVSVLELPPYLEWIGKFRNYDGRYANMDCILLRGDIPQSAQKHFNDFIAVKSSGRWTLLKKRLPASDEKLIN